MSDSMPAPSLGTPPTPPYCEQCAKQGHAHGDAKAGIAALRAAYAEGRSKAAYRRTRVLTHSDIAQALTEPPLRYTEPTRWEGHVPPAMIPTRFGWRPNRSAVRAALITICEYVVAREAEEASAPAESEDVA